MINKIESFDMKNMIDVQSYGDFNPVLYSPSSPFQISMAQTKETLMDVDIYRNFLYSAITNFRQSKFYKNYKAHIISLGIDRCQIHPNITAEQDGANLEMHHHVITIFDMALIITEHILNTYGSITTFDVEELLREAHKDHQANICFLCKTCHEIYHNSPENLKIPLSAGFGKPFEFLSKYRYGITKDFAFKLYYQLKTDLYNADENDAKIQEIMKIRDNVIKWSDYNEMFNRQ
ncbi:MAG: hypothetical protein IJ193_00050 [Bacilli bacterium]|nr:hypothetical protein [Bacilli bacterium]